METGREQMERSFRNLLNRSSSPVTANTLLDILNAGEGMNSLLVWVYFVLVEENEEIMKRIFFTYRASRR